MPVLSVQNSQIEETLRSSFAGGRQEQSLSCLLISQSRAVLLKKIDFKEAKKQTCAHDQKVKSKYISINMNEQLEKKKAVVVLNGEHKKSLDGEGLPQPKIILYDPNKLNTQWKQMARVGTGLNNLGNTCFCNATLQCLTFTPALYYYLTSKEHSQQCGIHGFCMICTLEEHVRNVTNRYGQSISPWSVVKNFKAISKSFVLGRQEDAHEFLRYVIDNMTKSLLGGKPKLDAFSKNTTAVHQIFGGYLRSQVRCKNCEHKSNTYDPFLDMALDIKEACNVQKALEHFTKGEALFGDNAYLCEKCKRKVGAVKRFSIHKVPNVMTLQLKRFDAVRLNKINKDVHFPETLNVRPYMSVKQGDPVHFKLYGVLVHQGFSTSSGHYFSFVKSPSGQWLKMDDARVFKVGLEQVLRQTAYILFYNRAHMKQSHYPSPIIGPHNMQQQQNTGIRMHKNINGPMGKPVNESSTPIIRKSPTSATVSKPNLLSTSPSTATGINKQTTQHQVPQFSKIASLAGREKVSFGIKTKTELKDANTKQQTVVPQNGANENQQNAVPLVIKIKDGKVVSNTASPPDSSKKVQLVQSNKKTPEAKRRLVPYSNGDGSSDDSDEEVSNVSKKVTNIKMSGIEPINGKSVLTNNKLTQHCSNVSMSSPSGKKSKQSNSSFEPIMDEKLKTTTEVPGAYAPLDRERNGGFKTPSPQLRNLDTGTLHVKVTPEQTKVNSTTKWTVFEPEQKSPSLASSSSSANSTSEWKIQSKSEQNGKSEDGFKPIDGVTQIAGWTVTINRTTPPPTETNLMNNSKSGTEKNGIDQNNDANVSNHHQINGKKDNGAVHLKDKLPCKTNKHHPGQSTFSFAQKVNGSNGHSVASPVTKLFSDYNDDKGLNNSESSSTTSGHSGNDSLLVDVSDAQPLIGQENGSHKKHKKKKKKKNKHDSIDEKMKVYDYNTDNESPHTSEKRKKKKKKHKYDDQDDKAPLLSSPSTCKRPHLETENGNSNQSSTSEELQWVEVTKKTLQSDSIHKEVPTQKWDQNLQKSNGHTQHHNENGHQRNNFHSSSRTWDGTRNNADVLKELHKESLQGYGSSVSAWAGGKSSIDQEVIRERRKDKKRTWDDDYEDELNMGKIKKMKKQNERKFGGPNYFQKFQGWNVENKNKHRNLFDEFRSPMGQRGNGYDHGNNQYSNSHVSHHHNHYHGNNNKYGFYGNTGNNSYHNNTPRGHGNYHHGGRDNYHHNTYNRQHNSYHNNRKFYR